MADRNFAIVQTAFGRYYLPQESADLCSKIDRDSTTTRTDDAYAHGKLRGDFAGSLSLDIAEKRKVASRWNPSSQRKFVR